jgi:cyclohexanone monooxygenase
MPRTASELDLLIVGAGFGGLAMLQRARQRGLQALAVDAAPSVGGTWWHNRYPGARVDIQSLEYSFGFDESLQQEWHWTERYASQPELLRYANHVADRFGLRDGLVLNCRVASAGFDEALQRWQIEAADGRHWRPRFLVMATGGLSTPNTPAFPGLARFAGRVLHTADWPHKAPDFSGRRVGVVGTGSSAVQLIPLVARQAAQLTVFQRTATYATPAHNMPLAAAYEAQIKADYAGFRERNRGMRTGFGSQLPAGSSSALDATPEALAAAFEQRWQVGGFALLGAFADLMTDLRANALAAEFVRHKIRQTVHDPATAELLCPQQPIGCKRLCVDSGGYYATFNRPNVRLVDVSREPIAEVVLQGLRVGTQIHELDTLILATGFDAMTGTLMRLPLQGRGGLTLQQHWAEGPRTQLGLMTAGFPNLFHLAGVGSAAAFTNVIVSIEHHVGWIADCIAHLRQRGATTIEATVESEAEWATHLQAMAEATVFLRCNSWYLGANIPGKPRRFVALAGGFPAYVQRCSDEARAGYPGFVIH